MRVYDFADDARAAPKVLWWASEPTTTSAKSGVVSLWSGEGFAHRASPPSSVPRDLVVGYLEPSGGGRDSVITPAKVSAAQLKPGQYWTRDGAKTAAQIDVQLGCG